MVDYPHGGAVSCARSRGGSLIEKRFDKRGGDFIEKRVEKQSDGRSDERGGYWANERVPISRFEDGQAVATSDQVSSEEPLEIRLSYFDRALPDTGLHQQEMTVAVTMRTPGHDAELAVGFLFGEGIIHSSTDVIRAEHCGPPSPGKGLRNVIKIELAEDVTFDPAQLDRHFYTSSSCGVCGKTSIDAVRAELPDTPLNSFNIPPDTLLALPNQLRQLQVEFKKTGGLHGAGFFDASGAITPVREDVGRHNAVDKLVGSLLLAGGEASTMPRGMMLSGRASFELVQKAAMARCCIVASIGPPSSLAVELAEEQAITLTGFVSGGSFNIYASPERIV